jgi:hypothetical protein
MARAIYQQLLADLARMDTPEDEKRKYEAMIRHSAAMQGVAGLDRPERVKYAAHLLAIGNARSIICRRLMSRYSIGRSQAYEVIRQAL